MMDVIITSFDERVALTPYKECTNQRGCMRGTTINSFEQTNLRLHDYRPVINDAEKRDIVAILKQIGFLRSSEGWKDYERLMLRIFLNPSPLLLEKIASERTRLGPEKQQVGVHVRCGGGLADSHETAAMVTMPILKTVPQIIRKAIINAGIPQKQAFVYVSTDSTYAFNYLKKALPHTRLLTSSLYKRGHAQFDSTDDVVKRSLIDLFLMANSHTFVATSSSGFSRVIGTMGVQKKTVSIHAPYSFTQFKHK